MGTSAIVQPATLRHRRRAKKAGLVYINSFTRGFTRRRCGKGFTYHSSTGRRLTGVRTLQRIEALVIPPAWEDVWICSRSNGHIQSVGRDAASRKQYLYHPHWEVISSLTKFDRLPLFAERLPRIRRRVRDDLKGRTLTKQRVLAGIVRLLDKAHIRVGCERYALQNGSHGATTLTTDHVEVDGPRISLEFPGKSGQLREIEFNDPKIAQIIRQCEEISGQYLFCYHNDAGEICHVYSNSVNEYLQDISGEEITAKDFRTWWGSVLALSVLADMEEGLSSTARRKLARDAVCEASQGLGNTKSVCRKSYIHPGLLAATETGELPDLIAKARQTAHSRNELRVHEVLFAELLSLFDFS